MREEHMKSSHSYVPLQGVNIRFTEQVFEVRWCLVCLKVSGVPFGSPESQCACCCICVFSDQRWVVVQSRTLCELRMLDVISSDE